VAIIGATSHATLVHKRRKLGVSDFALFCFLVPVTDDNLKLENQKTRKKQAFRSVSVEASRILIPNHHSLWRRIIFAVMSKSEIPTCHWVLG
jgi:CRISPR/Cas system-associated endonuclease Cas3-HD